MISLGLSTVEVLISCSSGCACSHGTAVIIVCCQGQMPAPCSSEVVNFLLLKVRSHWMVFTLHSYVIVCCHGQMPGAFSSQVVNLLPLKARSHSFLRRVHTAQGHCLKWPHGHCLKMLGAFSSQVVNLLLLKACSHSTGSLSEMATWPLFENAWGFLQSSGGSPAQCG